MGLFCRCDVATGSAHACMLFILFSTLFGEVHVCIITIITFANRTIPEKHNSYVSQNKGHRERKSERERERVSEFERYLESDREID